MKDNTLLTITSLLTMLLLTFHLADDVARGFEPGTLANLGGVLVLVVWLCATLLFGDRLSGYVIVILGSLLGTFVPYVHFRHAGVGRVVKAGGAFFFVWTLLALEATALLSLILCVRGLWSLRRRDQADYDKLRTA